MTDTLTLPAAQAAPLNLYRKLLAARKEVTGYLQKANKGHGFDYVSSSQVLGAVRDILNQQGLILIPSIEDAIITDKPTKSGGNWVFTQLRMVFTWVDVESGESLACRWYGQGADDLEKGVGKAVTYAEKYFILKFFTIATDKDDPDAWLPPNDGGGNPPNGQGGRRGNQNGGPRGQDGNRGGGNPPRNQPGNPPAGQGSLPQGQPPGGSPTRGEMLNRGVKLVNELAGKDQEKRDHIRSWLCQTFQADLPKANPLGGLDDQQLAQAIQDLEARVKNRNHGGS